MSEEVKDKLEEEIQEQEAIKEEVENVDPEENELDKVKAELEEYKKAYAIKMADFQNFARRKEKELQDFKEYAARDIILKVLENLDNLERAQLATNDNNNNNNIEALIEGLNMSVNNFKEMLKHEGVEEIEAQDKIYDATEHHAITTISDKEKENNTVVFVSQKGYKLKGRVIRPSMVVINKIEEESK